MLFRKKKIANEVPAPKIDEKLKISLPNLWPYRFIGNLLILTLIFATMLGIYIVKSNFVGQKLVSFSDYFLEFTSKIGFNIDDVLVYGRAKTPLSEVRNVIGLRRSDNIFAPDIHQIRADLEQLPWVKTAMVTRSYLPNIIEVKITERTIQAIWQHNGRFFPVDTSGNPIDTEQIPNIPLLLIIGKGAPQHLNELLDIIKSENDVYPRIKAASFVSERRWNIILDDIENGITIKLPAQNTDAAWKKLLKLNKTRGLLKRKLTIIDLRFDNKVLVTPRKLSSENGAVFSETREHGI